MLSASPQSLMRGMEQFILSGTLPAVKSVTWLDADVSCTNGTVIKLPKPFIGMTETDLGLWRYKCQHEIGHEIDANNKPHWKDIMQAHRAAFPSKLFWHISNILSDFVQEKNQLGAWYGRDSIILNGRELFMTHMVMPELDTSQKTGQLFLHDALKRTVWNPYLTAYPALHDPVFQGQLESCGDWNALRNEQDVFELAQKIFELFPDSEKDKADDDEEEGGGTMVSPHMTQEKDVEGAENNPMEMERESIKDDGTRATVDKAARINVRKPRNTFGKRRW